jgi:hypothetical protein
VLRDAVAVLCDAVLVLYGGVEVANLVHGRVGEHVVVILILVGVT